MSTPRSRRVRTYRAPGSIVGALLLPSRGRTRARLVGRCVTVVAVMLFAVLALEGCAGHWWTTTEEPEIEGVAPAGEGAWPAEAGEQEHAAGLMYEFYYCF